MLGLSTYFLKNCFCSSILPGHSKRQWLGINKRRRKWSLSQIFCNTLAASWTHNGSIESKLTVTLRNFFAKQSVRYRVRDKLFGSFVLALKCMVCQKLGWYNAYLQCLHVDDARILSSWDKYEKTSIKITLGRLLQQLPSAAILCWATTDHCNYAELQVACETNLLNIWISKVLLLCSATTDHCNYAKLQVACEMNLLNIWISKVLSCKENVSH
jgi:hypothetical protein